MAMTLSFSPMEPLLLLEPFQDDDFRYEVKWDGIRALVWQNGSDVRIFSRRGHDLTQQFPELHALPLAQANEAILDGEIIVLDENRRPDFVRVVRRLRLKKPSAVIHARQSMPAVFMAFDLLRFEKDDMRTKPWWRRQELLRQVVVPSAHVEVVESFTDGLALFSATKQMGLEGIVAKRRESHYSAGKRHRDWFKVKHVQEVEAYIGGLRRKADGTGRSLLLGLPLGDGRLTYIGQAASGMNSADWNWLQQKTDALLIPTPPFANLSVSDKNCLWLKPELRATVRFQAWTPAGQLRSPVIVRLF